VVFFLEYPKKESSVIKRHRFASFGKEDKREHRAGVSPILITRRSSAPTLMGRDEKHKEVAARTFLHFSVDR